MFNIEDMTTIHSDVKHCLLPLANGTEETVTDTKVLAY